MKKESKPRKIKKVKVNGKSVITSTWKTDVSKQVLGFAILPKPITDKYEFKVVEDGGIVQVVRK